MKISLPMCLLLPVLAIPMIAGIGTGLCAADFSMGGPKGKGMGKTTITSQTLEMVSGPSENVFYFSKNVHVIGNNLEMKADQMVVTAARNPNFDPVQALKSSSGTQMGTIQKIVGVGNVHISQEGREAVAGRAEFFPKKGKVVLTENPRVVDSQAIVSGWRITLTQGERRVIVEQNPEGGTRPMVDLQAIPNMGFDPKKQPATPAPQPQEQSQLKAVTQPAEPQIQAGDQTIKASTQR